MTRESDIAAIDVDVCETVVRYEEIPITMASSRRLSAIRCRQMRERKCETGRAAISESR